MREVEEKAGKCLIRRGRLGMRGLRGSDHAKGIGGTIIPNIKRIAAVLYTKGCKTIYCREDDTSWSDLIFNPNFIAHDNSSL